MAWWLHEGLTVPQTKSYARLLRRIELLGIFVAMLLLSGAVFPLLLSQADGSLTEAARAKLRMIAAPSYVIGLGLVALRPAAVLRGVQHNVLLMTLILLPLASILWSIGPSITLRRAMALTLSMAVAFVFATRFTPRQQLVVLAWVLGGATFLSLVAMAVLPGRALMPEDGALRGVFLHKNVLGWVACLTVVLGIAARLDVSARMRRTGLLLLVAGLAALLLSTSVTSLFAAFAAVVVSRVVLLVARLQGRARLAVVLGLILLIPLLALLLAVGFGPLLEALGKDPTLTGRVPLWSMIDAEISRHPLLGHGYGVFWTEGNPAVWSIWESQGWQAPNAHNGYRETMLGLGSVGLLLLIALTFRAVAQGVTLCSMAPGEGWILPVLIVCISLILNLSESIFLKQNDLLWLLYSASVISISCRHAALRHPVPEPARIVATAI